MGIKKDPSISLLRVVSMLSIILGHWCVMAGINDYQLLAIGVEIFLFISGYLYGNKVIDDYCSWWKKRFKRLIVPMWLCLLFVLAFRVFSKEPISFKSIIEYFCNLQGLDRIFINLKIDHISGMGQTWFLTVIVVCYLLMIILKNNSEVEEKVEKSFPIYLVITILLQILLAFIGIQISYILQFFIGYFLAKKKWLNKRNCLWVFALSLVICLARLSCRTVLDGHILYDHVIARLSFNVLSIFLIMLVFSVCDKYEVWMTKVVETKIWRILDLASYPLYLTHYMFLKGPMRIERWTEGLLMKTILFVVLTIIVSLIVLVLTEYNSLKRIVKK